MSFTLSVDFTPGFPRPCTWVVFEELALFFGQFMGIAMLTVTN
jgi:hypothetical protein